MNTERADFASLPWVELSPGAREKRFAQGATVVRLLELKPPFVEHEWCTKPHHGYVVSGELKVQLKDRSIVVKQGDGLLLDGGTTGAHKAVVDREVRLFLVEKAQPNV